MSVQLLNLKQKIDDKLNQTRVEMHRVQDMTKRDNLWIKIETLQWVLDQMLILKK